MIRGLGLPANVVKPFHPDLVKLYRRRAATESAWDLRHEHPERIRLALLTFYCARCEARRSPSHVPLRSRNCTKSSRA
jgi:hypothetical protein